FGNQTQNCVLTHHHERANVPCAEPVCRPLDAGIRIDGRDVGALSPQNSFDGHEFLPSCGLAPGQPIISTGISQRSSGPRNQSPARRPSSSFRGVTRRETSGCTPVSACSAPDDAAKPSVRDKQKAKKLNNPARKTFAAVSRIFRHESGFKISHHPEGRSRRAVEAAGDWPAPRALAPFAYG